MIETKEQARAVAESWLATNHSTSPFELAIAEVQEYEHCWVTWWNRREYVETGDILKALFGPGYLVINRRTGAVRQLSSGASLKLTQYLDQE